MANRFFDWVSRAASARFILGDRPRGKDLNAALDLVTANAAGTGGFDALSRGVCFSAQGVSGTSMASGAYTTVPFPTELYDTDAAFTPATGTFVVPVNGAGYYSLVAGICWQALANSSTPTIAVFKNGTLFVEGSKAVADQALGTINCNINIDMLLAAGDQITIRGYHLHTTGTARLLSGGGFSPFMMCQFRAVGAQA